MCAFSPKDSAIKLTREQEEKVKTMFTAELGEYFRGLAVEQKLVRRDNDPSILHAIEQPAQSERVSRQISLNGQSFTLEGDSEEELQAAEQNLLQNVFSKTQEDEQQPRDAQGRFARTDDAAMQAANDADLRAKLVLGEITPEEFLTKSQYMADYLKENYGLDRNAIEGQKYERSWAEATQSFLQRHPDWMGGSENQACMAKLLEENNLGDGIDGDKVAALEAAYEFAKENNLLVATPAVTAHRQISKSTSIEEIREAAKAAIGQPAAANLYENWRNIR